MSQFALSKFKIAFLCLLSIFALINLIGSFRPNSFRAGGDLLLRYNEVEVVKAGINPYAVFSNEVTLEDYTGMNDFTPNSKWRVHAYPPWEYTFLYPLTLLTRDVVGKIYFLLNLACVVLILAMAFRLGHGLQQNVLHGCFVAVCSVSTSFAIYSAQRLQNYGLLMTVALIGMIIALNKRHDVLAGLCWAFIMVKPQIGTLFIIPLLVKRNFTAVAIAMTTCLLATIPPALMCDRSPVELILNIVQAGPQTPFYNPIIYFMPETTVGPMLVINALVVIAIGIILTVRLRDAAWHLVMCPAIVCSLAWTVSRNHDFNIYSVALMLVGVHLVYTKSPRHYRWGVGLLLAFLGRWIVVLDDALFERYDGANALYDSLIGRLLQHLPDWTGHAVRATHYSLPMVVFIFAVLWLFSLSRTRDELLYSAG